MKTDIKGCSTCLNGQESFEPFFHKGQEYIQYDYRTDDGQLFSTVARDLANARKKRNNWLEQLRGEN